VSDDRERAIAEITAAGRATRKKSSRGMWIAAGIVGALGLIGFVILMLSDGTPGGAVRAPEARPLSFSLGLLLGVVIGLALGYVVFRHSSRRRP
jgi:ABC-type antimicrobial peptide transport system permease subunit